MAMNPAQAIAALFSQAPAAPSTAPGATTNPTAPTADQSNLLDPSKPLDATVAGLPATKEASPLAGFEKLWETPVIPEGTPDANAPIIKADPAKIHEAVKQIDFTKAVTQAVMAKINAGGPEAMQAMMQAMGMVSQQVMTSAMIAASDMANSALKTHTERIEASVNSQRSLLAAQDTLATNPLFQNPATKPMMDSLMKQIHVKNPGATSAELQKAAMEYIGGMVQLAAPATDTTTAATLGKDGLPVRVEQDWGKFLPTL